MKRYRVKVREIYEVEVEAENEDEAMEYAFDTMNPDLLSQHALSIQECKEDPRP